MGIELSGRTLAEVADAFVALIARNHSHLLTKADVTMGLALPARSGGRMASIPGVGWSELGPESREPYDKTVNRAKHRLVNQANAEI